jgi:shikimate kinase
MTSSSDALVLVGPMGAGKTSTGRRVAKALGVRFVDTDAVLAREHGAIPTLFAEHGEAHFRRLEREAVRSALVAGGVVSLGGGAILDPGTRADLATHRVVLLTVEPRVVASRLRDDSRPLLAGDDAMRRWLAIYAERRPLYEAVADVTIDTSTGPLQAAVDAIVAWYRRATPTEEQPA